MESQRYRKIELRRYYLSVRDRVAIHRRKAASEGLLRELGNVGRVLSFDSIGSEIDLHLLNAALAKKGALLLNRVENEKLVPYFVESLETLILSPSFSCKEPDPKICPKAKASDIDLILAPGLAFDRAGYRLGYGQGFYDVLLARMPGIATRGVGFLEQLSLFSLPRDFWDRPVNQILLF